MVLGSCYSFQGKSHKTSNTVCQDASVVKSIVGDWTVMATADGLGSCPKSDIGSKTAVETATSICVSAFPFDGVDDAILSLIRTAFNGAMKEIIKISEENGDDLSAYDTTLDLVIFNGSNKLYYGHSGDGGIYILNSKGIYTEITQVQEGEEAHSVKPLRCGNEVWELGIYEDEIAIVASFTDGIRDQLTPSILRNQKQKIDVPLANKFMFVDVYGMTADEMNSVLHESMKQSSIYLHSNSCKITDDVTMGILINSSVLIKDDPLEHYEAPDWLEVWKSVIESLYPNHKEIKQHARRHMLVRYINENPEKVDIEDEKLEKTLDKYYPLTPEEKELYKNKYGSPSEPQGKKSDEIEDSETSEKSDESKTSKSEISSDDSPVEKKSGLKEIFFNKPKEKISNILTGKKSKADKFQSPDKTSIEQDFEQTSIEEDEDPFIIEYTMPPIDGTVYSMNPPDSDMDFEDEITDELIDSFEGFSNISKNAKIPSLQLKLKDDELDKLNESHESDEGDEQNKSDQSD